MFGYSSILHSEGHPTETVALISLIFRWNLSNDNTKDSWKIIRTIRAFVWSETGKPNASKMSDSCLSDLQTDRNWVRGDIDFLTDLKTDLLLPKTFTLLRKSKRRYKKQKQPLIRSSEIELW